VPHLGLPTDAPPIAHARDPTEAGIRAVRRLLLRRTHYHVYFVPHAERVYVVAVWSAFRGRAPKLCRHRHELEGSIAEADADETENFATVIAEMRRLLFLGREPRRETR
jgi:hypothetical protein